MFKVIFLSIIIVAIAVLALAVKMFFKKGGMFTKTCSSVDEKGNRVPCTCKASGPDKCEHYEEHHEEGH